MFLNAFQSFIFFVFLYLSRMLLQLASHQLLECLVILIVLKWWFQKLSANRAIVWTMFSREFSSCISKVSITCIEAMKLLMKFFSSSLFLIKTCFLVEKHYSKIGIQIESGAWSEMNHQFRWIWWLLNSSDLCLRNIRSMTKFELCSLSTYLVGTQLVGADKSRSKMSATSKRISLWEEWNGYIGSYKLLWILKSPIIMRTLLMLTPVSLKYLRAVCEESK